MSSERPRPSQTPQSADRHLDVRVARDASGRPEVVLQDLSYTEGLGWCAQKTIRVDAQQIDAVLAALCRARQECRARQKCRASDRGSERPGQAPPASREFAKTLSTGEDGKVLSIESILAAAR